MSKVLIAEGLDYNLLSISQLMAKGIHLEVDSTTQKFKLYHGKRGLYIGKAVLKNNVFVLDFVPDLGTADSDAIVNFTNWTHPPDLDPDFSPEGFCGSVATSPRPRCHLSAAPSEPPSSRAALQPSRRSAPLLQPSRPAAAAEPPSSRAAEPPSCYTRAADPLCSRVAVAPTDAPWPLFCSDRPYLLRLGRAVDFEVWLDDLQLFLQCDRVDGLSLFDLTSGVSPTPPATADSTVRSQWATRDAAARLAVRRHLPTTERAHFSQYRSAQTLYDAVVARYSSPATAALSRLFLPYLFPDLAAFPTVADLITHLRTSDTRYRAALPAELCAKNPPPLYLTLYYVVTRLPDSLRVVRDHFLSVCPTTLTVDLLEERLLAAEQSIVAVGASRGDPRTPIFEGCSPSPLLPSVASATAADLGGCYGHNRLECA
ncbi:unnamed protein product [Closterium sp. NIES-53]